MAVMCLEGFPGLILHKVHGLEVRKQGESHRAASDCSYRYVIAAAAAARHRPHAHPTNTRPARGTGTLLFSPENRFHVSGLALLGAGASDWESHASVDCRLTGKGSFWLLPFFLLQAELQVAGEDSETPSSLHSDPALTQGTLAD